MTVERDPEGIETRHLHRLVDFGNSRVLEIGCGDGRLTWRYAQAAGRVIGIDPNAERLAAAVQACPADLARHIAFLRADATALPFREGCFGRAILAWSL